MSRLLWFITGCIITYVASGYIEGLLIDDEGNAQPTSIPPNNSLPNDAQTQGGA